MAAPRDKKGDSGPVLITGAAGFIGAHTVRALSHRQIPVRAAVHRAARASRLGEFQGDIYVGDIVDSSFVRSAVTGARAVVHLAARIRGGDPCLIRRVNVEGTVNLIKACEESGVGRFVFMSTPQVSSPVSTAYGESKRAAEEAVRESSLAWTIVRPVLAYGPGDDKDLTRVARFVFRWPLVPVIGDGKALIQPIYIDDCAEAIVRVLENDVSVGKIYELAGPAPLSFNDFIDVSARAAGKRCVKIHVPLRIAMLLGIIMQKVSKKPVLTREVVRGMTIDKTAQIEQAGKDLGLSPRSVQTGVRELLMSRG